MDMFIKRRIHIAMVTTSIHTRQIETKMFKEYLKIARKVYDNNTFDMCPCETNL